MTDQPKTLKSYMADSRAAAKELVLVHARDAALTDLRDALHSLPATEPATFANAEILDAEIGVYMSVMKSAQKKINALRERVK